MAGYGSWALISLLQRVPDLGHGVLESSEVCWYRGVSGREQHRVPLRQGDLEVLGQGEDELG